jgi:hypothetical protein
MFLDKFFRRKEVKTGSRAISKCPSILGVIGQNSQDIVDSICLGLITSKASITTFRPDSLVESAVKAAFGWGEINEGIDPVTSISSLQAFEAFKSSLREEVWVSHLYTVYGLANSDIFIVHDTDSPLVVDWIHSIGGKTIGTPGCSAVTMVKIEDEGVSREDIAKLVESL